MTYMFELNWKIDFKSRWHIGSGMGGGIIDRMVVRDYINRPFLAGSTLKGVVREQCEKIAAALGFCNIKDPNDEVGLENFCAPAENNYIIDRLFGSSYSGETLFFRNAGIDRQCDERFDMMTITRSRRERLTSVAAPNCLYNMEEIMPMRFSARLTGYHAIEALTWTHNENDEIVRCGETNWPLEYSLLLAGIIATDKIGSSKSQGLGHFVPGELSMILNGKRVTDPLQYIEYLRVISGENTEEMLEVFGWR